MTIQEYLDTYAAAGRRAARYRKEYEAERKKLGTIRSGVGDGTPRSGKISKPTEQQATRLAAKAEKWKEAELEEIRIQQEIAALIARVPEPYGTILYARYIEGKEWEEVGDAVGFSERHARRLHDRALEIIGEIERCPPMSVEDVLL